MRAVYITEHGGIDKLIDGELPDPVPDANEAVVRVKACGVNHMDLWVRRGLPFLRLQFPFILGMDIAGEVAAVGSQSDTHLIGMRVVVHPGVSCARCERCLSGWDNLCPRYQLIGEQVPGGYAQLLKVPVQNLVPLPPGLPFEAAACLPVVFSTAWNMVFDKARLQAGEWVLIHAGGSGIGSAAIQLARLVGANIITTTGSDAKVKKALDLGAHFAINYQSKDFLREVRRITKKRGVDVVIEHVGGEVWERSLLCLATGGRLVSCGATSGYQPQTDLRHVFFRNLKILGATMGSKAWLVKIVRLVQEGKLRPVLDRVMPLKHAQEAHRLMEQRQHFGKLVLTLT
jgi:NADPH:quinone reductase-like Zn-dependent oxidoreductase